MSMVEFTGQTYGEGRRQRASQRMMRPGPSPTDVQAQRAAGSRRATVPRRRMSAPAPSPGQDLPPLMRPTEAPDEPITAGAPFGPGPSAPMTPVAIQPGSTQDLALRVRAIASRYPNPALLQLLQIMEQRNGMA